MATPHIWHKLHLHGAKIGRVALLTLVTCGLSFGAQAQKKSRASKGSKGQVKSITVDNLPGYDDKWFHPGMYIAPSFSRYKLEQSSTYTQARNVSANSIISPGLSVGFIADVRLADNFNLRFTPGASFVTRRVEFKPFGYSPADSILTQEIGGTQIDFPLLLKFKSDRRRNSRMYVIGGIKSSVGVGNRRKDPARNLLRASSGDFAIEYGVGMDLFYPLFKFGPELRFSHGLSNQLQPGKDVYSRSLQSLKSNTVTLYLNIE
ncbi:probable protein-translocating porin PorT [Hymenobacter daecheongensis DSM 21074]|uniref:Probable protein-translocating porin PorT n=1 Tax=Hymenobacter daecheongensis DSM 21074 TaxID=1121955 RepID=A0A1M6E552_9BACT|nr:porin family protein [Hymenobacter daecheongensis]SHI80571.1 probable protein-translocating porin PorT [Hymenobacter daecheongensis DSM 21074]